MSTKNPRVTSKQVAKLAGVSQTTVSFVLNNVETANISEETRQKVLAAAQQLNYVPDMAARSLALGRGNNIALLLEQPHNQVFIDEYIPKILTGINQVTQPKGFRILVESVTDANRASVYTSLVQSKEAAGVIVNFTMFDDQDMEQVLQYTHAGVPIVSLADIHPDVYSVSVDKYEGTRRVIQHLIDLNYRRIACISYAPVRTNLHADTRLEIFQELLQNAGIDYDESLVRYGDFDPETGYEAMKSILKNRLLPDALYAMNDVMAFGAMAAIHEAGLRIPEDIAVVGFDDIRLARYSTPPLTTVNEPDIEHGRRATEMLIALINGEIPPVKHVVLDTELVVRASCGASLTRPS